MMHFFGLFISFLLLGILSGCGNSVSEERSRLTLKLPKSFSSSSKASLSKTQSGLSSSPQLICFAVNVMATDLEVAGRKSCDPAYGQVTDFVPGGSEISLDIPSGNARSIELYYIVGQNGTCPSFDAKTGLGNLGSNRVHRLAKLEGVNMNDPEITVKLPISLPSHSNTLGVLESLPRDTEGENYKISVRVGPVSTLLKDNNNKIQILPHQLGGR